MDGERGKGEWDMANGEGEEGRAMREEGVWQICKWANLQIRTVAKRKQPTLAGGPSRTEVKGRV